MPIVDIPAETELLACPLCGSEAVLKSDTVIKGMGTNNEMLTKKRFWVKCQGGDCSISPASADTIEKATARWNRRAF